MGTFFIGSMAFGRLLQSTCAFTNNRLCLRALRKPAVYGVYGLDSLLRPRPGCSTLNLRRYSLDCPIDALFNTEGAQGFEPNVDRLSRANEGGSMAPHEDCAYVHPY